MTKEEIIADEGLFQSACGKLVEQNVIISLSMLMFPIGQNLETAARIFEYDYDDMLGWFYAQDWESAAREEGWDKIEGQIVRKAGELVDYPAVSPNFDPWDVLHENTTPAEVNERFKLNIDLDEVMEEDEVVWPALSEDQQAILIEEYQKAVADTADTWQEACEQDAIDPREIETYEFWAVSHWFAQELEAQGETTFEFCNFNVWARTTTGMAIAIDEVTRSIAREQSEHSFIWSE